MVIQLNPAQQQVIGQAIQAGLIRDAEDVIEAGVEAIRRRLEARQSPTLSPSLDIAMKDWSSDLRTWIHARSSAAPPLSDESISRESIYATNGF
jgi:hypothetical protein